jgi:hypothetical protein
MNSDTFASFSAAYPSGHPFSLPAAFTTTSATQTAFLLSNGNQAVIQVPQGTEILGAQTPFSINANSVYSAESGRAGKWLGETRPFFNSNSFNNRPFRVRAVGQIVGGGTTATSIAATLVLYAALTNTATVTSGTAIATVGSGAVLGNVSANWLIECELMWDSVSQSLSGYKTAFFGNTTVGTYAASATSVTSVTIANLNFGLTWQFATTSTSNKIGMVELSLEQV